MKLPMTKLHKENLNQKLFFQLIKYIKMETLLTPVAKSRKYQKISQIFGDAFLFLKDESGAVTKIEILFWPKIIMVILALISSTPYVIIIYIFLTYKFNFLGYLKDENMGLTDITTIMIYHIVQWLTLILYWFGINKFANSTSRVQVNSNNITGHNFFLIFFVG